MIGSDDGKVEREGFDDGESETFIKGDIGKTKGVFIEVRQLVVGEISSEDNLILEI